jgi:hypothetical protein
MRHTVRSIASLMAVVLAACSTTAGQGPAGAGASEPRLTSGELRAPPPRAASEGDQRCDVVCERARIVARPSDTPDHTARAEANANAVFAAMHDDLLGCYTKRLRAAPKAHASIAVELVVAADGQVQRVESTGGALLGRAALACVVRRIERARFEPPNGGGTLRVQTIFTLRPQTDAERSM